MNSLCQLELFGGSASLLTEPSGSGMRHGKVVEFHDTRFEATHRLAQEVQLQRQLYTPAGQNLRLDNLLSAHREAVASRSPSNAPERLWLTATCRGWDDNTPLRELEVFRDVEHQGARLEKVGTVLFRACNGQADTSSTWTTAPEAAKWMQKVVEPVSVYQMYAPLEEWLCSPIGLRLCPLAVRFGAFFEYGPEKYRSYLVNDVAGEEVFAVRDNRRQVLRIYERL